jgi:hypothetical protein
LEGCAGVTRTTLCEDVEVVAVAVIGWFRCQQF